MPSFARPLLLLLIPVFIFLLWRFQQKSFASAGKARRIFWFILRGFIITLLISALAGMQLATKVKRNQVLFLIDASDSLMPEQREAALRWINQAIRRIPPQDQTGIISFGVNAAVERFPSSPKLQNRLEAKIDTNGTNLEAAGKLAAALFADNFQKNLVIVSDGNDNAGDPEKLFERLRQEGIAMQSHYLEPAEHPEAGMVSVRVQDRITRNQTFPLEVVSSANEDTAAILQIYRNGALLQEGTLQLEKNKKLLLRLPQKITEPGLYRYQIQLKPEKDFRVENNTEEIWINVEGPSRILLMDRKVDDLKNLFTALARRGFQVEIKSEQNFPYSLQEMLLYQSIFVRNIPASQIHTQMPALKKYVHDFGGGFAMLGGESSFGPGGYFKTPVEELLPVTMDLINKKYLADVAMVVVIDKSGSMSYTERGRQKIDLADEGAARVAAFLKKTDQLGVLAVDSVPKWAFELQRLGNTPEAIDAITSIRAGGGGIYVYSGLQEAYRKLRETKAAIKHVILFADTADCEEKEGPTGEPSLVLAQSALQNDQITTTTIGIGQTGDVDVGFLEQMATIGAGRFYFTNDMYTLPEIFTQESAIVQRYYINEERFHPRIADQDPILTGIDAVPDLLAYVATTPKPAARVALWSHRDDPVLAFWRYGLGYSLAFTSDAAGSWAEPWAQWSGFERFWAQAGRYLTGDNRAPRFQWSQDANNIVVDALDEKGNFLNNAQFAGVLVDDSENTHKLTFNQTGPGRYETEVTAKGNLFGKIFQITQNATAEEAIVHLRRPRSREYEFSSGGKERLRKLTGRLVENPADLRYSSGWTKEVQPLQNQLLWWAAFLFLIDVAARKIELRTFQRDRQELIPAPESAVSWKNFQERKKSVEKEPSILPPILLLEEGSAEVSNAPEPEPMPEAGETDVYIARLKAAKQRKNIPPI